MACEIIQVDAGKSRWRRANAQTIRTDSATEWKYVPAHSKNEFNPGRSPFLLATNERLYLKFSQKER
jgi:hypothetical protein